MATFKVTVHNKRRDGYWPVYIRVTQHRESRYLPTDKIVDPKSVNKKTHEVKDPYVLQLCTTQIANYVDMLNRQNTLKWDVDEVVEFLKNKTSDINFSEYARTYRDGLLQNGQQRSAKNYELAFHHLERFAGTDQLMFSQLTTPFVNKWIKTLEKTSRAKEMYPVCVRQIFRQALKDYNDYDNGLLRITTNPWIKVVIPKSDTLEKRAITMEECRAFFAAPLPPTDRILSLSELGRDVAMMVLCLAGINTVDIYNLKKSNLQDGVLCYERAKTGQRIFSVGE
nr:site-specific integrase [Prevotella sp.]